MVDVTDATFETEVLARSEQVPVVVDLWAEWCGPCRTLGPILERVIGATDGGVVLAKIDVDSNRRASETFRVQGIPAVYALKDRRVVDGFVGAQPESVVQEFVDRLLPTSTEQQIEALIATGDEDSIRQALELSPAHEGAIVALARVLIEAGRNDEGLAELERIPETAETRHLAALARSGDVRRSDDIVAELDGLLDQVREDDTARQRFLDLLELLGPDHEATAGYRRKLSARLF